MLATLLLPLALLASPQEHATATELVDQARTFLPAYAGERRAFLTAVQKSEVQAAAHILSAARALEPDNTYALWWNGHAEALLGEDQLNRGHQKAGASHFDAALLCFQLAIEQQPDYLWAWYARAMAYERVHVPQQAIRDFERCIDLAEQTIAADTTEAAVSEARFLKYKARLWRADCRMQLFQFTAAREEFRAFYADNGNNPWDLGIKIAESYQRERDFVSAIATYEKLLEVPEYADYDGAYTFLGYLEGLLENFETAAQRLNEALQRERQPTLYPRLWLYILAPEDQKAEALDQLKRFVAHPPGDLSAWDLKLGRFLSGEGTAEDFMAAAREEEQRRMIEAIDLDDLMCEAWFYAGLRQEWNGAKDAAVEAYKQALTFRPAAFKWEWAYARLHFALLVRTPALWPSGAPNNAPPRVHLFRNFYDPETEGMVLGTGELQDSEGYLEELREHGSKGDLIQIITDYTALNRPAGCPQLEVIGVPLEAPTGPEKN